MVNWRRKFNLFSLYFSVVCWAVFFWISTTSVFPYDGHLIVLWLSIVSLFASVYGLGGISNWKNATTSFVSVILSGLLVSAELILLAFAKFVSSI